MTNQRCKKKCDKCGIMRNELYRRGSKFVCGRCSKAIGGLSKHAQSTKAYKRRKEKVQNAEILRELEK